MISTQLSEKKNHVLNSKCESPLQTQLQAKIKTKRPNYKQDAYFLPQLQAKRSNHVPQSHDSSDDPNSRSSSMLSGTNGDTKRR